MKHLFLDFEYRQFMTFPDNGNKKEISPTFTQALYLGAISQTAKRKAVSGGLHDKKKVQIRG